MANANKIKTSGEQLKELHVRFGVPNFKSKMENKDSVTIAHFGGSITYQKGWRIKSFEWFETQFPKTKFKHVNAAIGGTRSQLGAFRVKEHVLKYKPDLVFVEFAVNDSDLAKDKILNSMEGIVRQIWQQNITTDICFIYTLKQDMVEMILAGEKPPSVIAMEQIATHYNIPSIWFAPEVTELVRNNQLIIKGNEKSINGIPVFSRDGVHPYFETGHEIYANVFKRSIPLILEKDRSAERMTDKPLRIGNLENARMIDPANIELKGSWVTQVDNEVTKKFKNNMPQMIKAGTSGAKVIIKFTGTQIGCFDIMGPDAGRVIVSIDRIIKDTVYRFDKYCTYHRMNNFLIDDLKTKYIQPLLNF